MARIRDEEDTRPRNPEHRRRIAEMMDPKKLLHEIDMDNIDSREHSIDDCLENSSDFRRWAQEKRKGTNLDPEYIRPIQISESPFSDFDIRLTRCDQTADTITPASLSNWNVPQASNASLTMLNQSTPRRSLQKSKLPRTTPRSNIDLFTPNLLLRGKQIRDVKKGMKRRATVNGKMTPYQNTVASMDSEPSEPERIYASTPVRNEKLRPFFNRLSGVDAVSNESIASIPNDEAAGNVRENDENTFTPANDESERTLTNKHGNENVNVSETIIPETQENESIIPETQDDYVPETQENDTSTTADTVANNPVQAQVAKLNPEQQAEPQNKHLGSNTRRIQSRPPIHGQSTPLNHVPSSPAVVRQVLKTHLPIPLSQTPKPIRTTALTPLVQNQGNEVVSLNTSARRVLEEKTPVGQSNEPRVASPLTVIPAPTNVTVNVNVNNSIPQSPQQNTQDTQTIRTNDQNIADAPNAGFVNNKRSTSNSNNSLLTDDDSVEFGSNSSARSETPKTSTNNNSVSRKLFADNDGSYRRSATFDKIPSQLLLQQPNRGLRSKSINSTVSKTPNTAAPANSQTFTKQRTPKQNATYNIAQNNTEDCLSSYALNSTVNTNRNTFGNLDLPSEALLPSIDLTQDNEIDENRSSVANSQSTRTSSQRVSGAKNKTKTRSMQTSTDRSTLPPIDWNPTVVIQRIETNTPEMLRISIEKRKNSLNLRDSQPFEAIPPPGNFQDTSIIVEGSPTTSQRLFDERLSFIKTSIQPIRKTAPDKVMPRRRTQIGKNEDLAVVERNLKEIENKPRSSTRLSRRLRSEKEIHENDETDATKNTESENVNSSTNANANANANESAHTDNNSFKKPIGLPPRRTRATTSKINESKASSATTSDLGTSQEEFTVTYEIDPVIENDSPNIHVDDNEPSTSHQTEQRLPSPKRKPNARSKSRTTKAKQSNKSQPEVKQPEIVNDSSVESSSNFTSDGVRKSTRAKLQLEPRLLGLLDEMRNKTQKRKLDSKPPRSAPVRSTQSDDVSAPPSKRPRTNSDLPNKTNKPSASSKSEKVALQTSRPHSSKVSFQLEKPSRNNIDVQHKMNRPSKTSKSEIVGPRTSRIQTSKMSLQLDRTSKGKHLSEFTQHLIRKEAQFKKLQWWRELNDLDQKDPIFHNDEEVDVRHVKANTQDSIEVSTSDKIEYHEMNGVDYGFIPSAVSRRCGFMRFPPNAAKDKGPTHDTIFLCILRGQFTVEVDDSNLEVSAGADIPIPKGALFGLRNQSDNIGIVYFCYN